MLAYHELTVPLGIRMIVTRMNAEPYSSGAHTFVPRLIAIFTVARRPGTCEEEKEIAELIYSMLDHQQKTVFQPRMQNGLWSPRGLCYSWNRFDLPSLNQLAMRLPRAIPAAFVDGLEDILRWALPQIDTHEQRSLEANIRKELAKLRASLGIVAESCVLATSLYRHSVS